MGGSEAADKAGNVEFPLLDILLPLLESWKLVILAPLVVAALSYAATLMLIPDVTLTSTVWLPPPHAMSEIEANAEHVDVDRISVTRGRTDDESLITYQTPSFQPDREGFSALLAKLETAADESLVVRQQDAEERLVFARETIRELRRVSANLSNALARIGEQDAEPRQELADIVGSFATVIDTFEETIALARVDANMLSRIALAPRVTPVQDNSRHTQIVLVAFGTTLFLALAFIFVRGEWRYAKSLPEGRERIENLRRLLPFKRGRG